MISRQRRELETPFSKVSIRPIEIQHRKMFQFTQYLADRVTHENFSVEQTAVRAGELLERSFCDAMLYTSSGDFTIRRRDDGSWRTTKKPPTKGAAQSDQAAHNRTKGYLIPEGVPCPFLIEIGVMTPDGKIRQPMMRKFRQINRFLEFVEDVVPALGNDQERELRVVDFGCGKSYLTFAIHHLLTSIHGRRVRIIGLDRKKDVMQHCSEIAGRLRCEGLEFRQEEIASHREDEPVDMAVSLHACDTATDAALAQAVSWNSKVILAVPCCQHEVARQLNNPDLEPLLKHGILREQFASLATDALRALALESQGYVTQVMEFIDLEHTAKNILIRAVRRERSDKNIETARRREFETLCRLLGIQTVSTAKVVGNRS